MQQVPAMFKFLLVAIIWVVVGIVSIVQLVVASNLFFLLIIMFGMAVGATGIILNNAPSASRRPMIQVNTSDDNASRSSGKRKNEQAGGLSPDMLALLDDDDIAELRQRVKNRLIDRIEGGSDGELSSLDALLADQDAPRKNRR